jgi:hypothetical protein
VLTAECAIDVLPEDEGGFGFVPDANLLKEQRGSGARVFGHPSSLASQAQVLTGRSACNHRHAAQGGAVNLGDIAVQGRVRPMVAQDGPSVGFNFGVTNTAPPRHL